jgi:tRNA1Val (adenine37-N6)-methyltransferase
MAGSIFKFKQFDVDQNGCAMKVNTDGVLLGALATGK